MTMALPSTPVQGGDWSEPGIMGLALQVRGGSQEAFEVCVCMRGDYS